MTSAMASVATGWSGDTEGESAEFAALRREIDQMQMRLRSDGESPLRFCGFIGKSASVDFGSEMRAAAARSDATRPLGARSGASRTNNEFRATPSAKIKSEMNSENLSGRSFTLHRRAADAVADAAVAVALFLRDSGIASSIATALSAFLAQLDRIDRDMGLHSKIIVVIQIIAGIAVQWILVVMRAVVRAVAVYHGRNSSNHATSDSSRSTWSTHSLAEATQPLSNHLGNATGHASVPLDIVAPKGTVIVSVGGRVLVTQHHTLVSDPSTRFPSILNSATMSPPTHPHTVFIDRDGTHFHHILNWLRGVDSTSSIASSESALHELLIEAEYFRVIGLRERVLDRMASISLTTIT